MDADGVSGAEGGWGRSMRTGRAGCPDLDTFDDISAVVSVVV